MVNNRIHEKEMSGGIDLRQSSEQNITYKIPYGPHKSICNGKSQDKTISSLVKMSFQGNRISSCFLNL
jgi:hypothetical protein